MKSTRQFRRRLGLWIVAGGVCGALAMMMLSFSIAEVQAATGVQSAAWNVLQETQSPEPLQAVQPTTETPPKDCAECHPDIGVAWNASPHAAAYSSAEFTAQWSAIGRQAECLVCHTTGYQATSGEFSAEGVTCSACHGAAVEGHPPAAIPVLADTEHCGACHTTTHAEWRLTGHASAGVGCTACHNPHSQAALFDDPDELCVNCHKDDIGKHGNDLHLEKGIGCVDCHALTLPPETPPINGLAPTGHAFTMTPATCVACHTDTLRIGAPLPGYEAGALAMAAGETMTGTLTAPVQPGSAGDEPGGAQPEQQIQALEAALASTRISTLFQGGIIGLVLGGTTAYFVAGNLRRQDEEEAQDDEDPQTPPAAA